MSNVFANEIPPRVEQLKHVISKFKLQDDLHPREDQRREIEQSIKLIDAILSVLDECPMSSWPDSKWSDNALEEFNEFEKRFREFVTTQSDASLARDGMQSLLLNRARVSVSTGIKTVEHLMSLIFVSRFMNSGVYDMYSLLREDYEEVIVELKNRCHEMTQLADRAKANVEKSQRMLTDSAVESHKGNFKTKARAIGNFAQWWLFSAILCAIGVVAVAVGYQPPISSEASSLSVLQALSSKAALVGIFFGAAFWCGRIYRSQLHQVAVNEHRQLSLDTFQAFMAASPNDHTRDAVLLAATNAVFGNQPTGLGGETSSQEAAFNIGISGAANPPSSP